VTFTQECDRARSSVLEALWKKEKPKFVQLIEQRLACLAGAAR
jgi:hypothetical protein